MQSSRALTGMLRACLLAAFAIMTITGTARSQESFVATHFSVPEGDNEVPPVEGDAGYAVAIMRYDPMTSSLDYRISVALPAGQTITAAHFHRGARGVSGDPIASINFAPGQMTATGTWFVTGQDLVDLLNQNIYLNIHTNENPDGQLRDQVHPIPNLAAPDMSAREEVSQPGGVEDATGNALLFLDEIGRHVVYALEWESLSGPPTMAHFHRGAVGVNGPPVHSIPIPGGAGAAGVTTGVWDNLSDMDISDLKSEGFYANVHTEQNPNGEIRAQVRTNDFFTAAISPANEVGIVDGSSAIGTGFATVVGGDTLQAFAVIGGTTSAPDMAHIHQAPKGENGEIVFPLTGLAILGYPDVWLAVNEEVTEDRFTAFMNTGMYMNFHTAGFPQGEARGQLIPAAGNLNRATSSVPPALAGAEFSSWYDASSGLIHIRMNDAPGMRNAVVAVYSPLGRRVATLPVRSGIVETGGMPAGIYFVQLLNDGAPVGVAPVAVTR